MVKCKYYDGEFCPEDCEYDWRKCDICGKYIEPNNDDLNGFIIYSAILYCDVFAIETFEMAICPDCFMKIKKSKTK